MSPDDLLAGNMFFWAVVCGTLALIAPWIALWFNRWVAAGVAGALALFGTILESISNRHIPSNVNIRADLVIILPLLALAWLECVGLTIFAALKSPPPKREKS